MSAIITDQIRILNAKNFVNEVRSSGNSYYSFVGLPNPSDYQCLFAYWRDQIHYEQLYRIWYRVHFWIQTHLNFNVNNSTGAYGFK